MAKTVPGTAHGSARSDSRSPPRDPLSNAQDRADQRDDDRAPTVATTASQRLFDQRTRAHGVLDERDIVSERVHRRERLDRPGPDRHEGHQQQREMGQEQQTGESPGHEGERRTRRRDCVPATRAGAAPFVPRAPAIRRVGTTQARTSAARARSVSPIVSTMASALSPLSRVATICVVMTRKPPPKRYGALNEPSDVMNVSSAAPPIAGRSCGRTTRRNGRHRPAPRLAAASSSDASSEARRGAREEIEVDVHRVGVNQQDRPGALEPPRRLLQAENALDQRARRSRSRRRERGRRAPRRAAAERPAARPPRRGAARRGTRSGRRERRAASRSRRRAPRSRARSRGCPRARATRWAAPVKIRT